MRGWREFSLLDLAELHDQTRVPLSKMEREKRQGVYPYYGASGVIDHVNGYLFDGQYLLISEDGENLKSRQTPIAFIADGKFWVNNHAHVLKGKKDFYNKFIAHYFMSLDLNPYLTGAVQPKLSQSSLLSIPIFLPSNELEQKTIAAVLSSLDDKIDLLHRQNKTLEAMVETLFRQWFVEEAQEDWEEKPLNKICTIQNGYAFKSSTYQDFGQKIIRTLNFSNHWIKLNDLVFISDDLAKDFEKYYLRRQDFLLVMVGASLGNYAIVTKEVLPALQNQNMWCFRAKNGVKQHYLNYALRNLVEENLFGASGSARDFFQKGVFYELKLKIPPESLMTEFDKVAARIFEKIELNRKQLISLQQLRDTLLPKLMSGEVRVDYEH